MTEIETGAGQAEAPDPMAELERKALGLDPAVDFEDDAPRLLGPAWDELLARGGRHVGMTLDTLRGDLRSSMLDILRAMPKPFTVMSEFEQMTLIQAVDNRAVKLLGEAILLLSGAGFEAAHGLLIKAETKDGLLKTQVNFSRNIAQRHDISDAVGREITVILVDREAFMGEREPDLPEPDQHELIKDGDGGTTAVAAMRGRGKGKKGGKKDDGE